MLVCRQQWGNIHGEGEACLTEGQPEAWTQPNIYICMYKDKETLRTRMQRGVLYIESKSLRERLLGGRVKLI